MDPFKNVTGPPLVRAHMAANKVTNVAIANQEQVTPVYVSNVITGVRTGYRIRRAIAAACKVTVETLWPDTPPEHRMAA